MTFKSQHNDAETGIHADCCPGLPLQPFIRQIQTVGLRPNWDQTDTLIEIGYKILRDWAASQIVEHAEMVLPS
jgi:hypothetical protein